VQSLPSVKTNIPCLGKNGRSLRRQLPGGTLMAMARSSAGSLAAKMLSPASRERRR
jgi:hypothetical protein